MNWLMKQKNKDVGVPIKKSLEELFDEARSLGNIYLHQADDGTFSFTIEFQTIPGVNLKAKSGFRHQTIESAIESAISTAYEIKNQFKGGDKA